MGFVAVVSLGAWETARLALQIGEDAVAAFLAQTVEFFAKEAFISIYS
jgi:hypothetical protein